MKTDTNELQAVAAAVHAVAQANEEKVITFANLHKHTAQEVFDFVCKRVLQQGKPGVATDNGSCVYLNRNSGLRCAAGMLTTHLPDYFVAAMRGSVEGFTTKDAARLGWQGSQWGNGAITLYAHFGLLRRLQDAHDSAADGIGAIFSHHFRRAASKIAQDLELKPAVLTMW